MMESTNGRQGIDGWNAAPLPADGGARPSGRRAPPRIVAAQGRRAAETELLAVVAARQAALLRRASSLRLELTALQERDPSRPCWLALLDVGEEGRNDGRRHVRDRGAHAGAWAGWEARWIVWRRERCAALDLARVEGITVPAALRDLTARHPVTWGTGSARELALAAVALADGAEARLTLARAYLEEGRGEEALGELARLERRGWRGEVVRPRRFERDLALALAVAHEAHSEFSAASAALARAAAVSRPSSLRHVAMLAFALLAGDTEGVSQARRALGASGRSGIGRGAAQCDPWRDAWPDRGSDRGRWDAEVREPTPSMGRALADLRHRAAHWPLDSSADPTGPRGCATFELLCGDEPVAAAVALTLLPRGGPAHLRRAGGRAGQDPDGGDPPADDWAGGR